MWYLGLPGYRLNMSQQLSRVKEDRFPLSHSPPHYEQVPSENEGSNREPQSFFCFQAGFPSSTYPSFPVDFTVAENSMLHRCSRMGNQNHATHNTERGGATARSFFSLGQCLSLASFSTHCATTDNVPDTQNCLFSRRFVNGLEPGNSHLKPRHFLFWLFYYAYSSVRSTSVFSGDTGLTGD